MPSSQSNLLTPEIVGGVESSPHSRPYMVALEIDDYYFCGGTIVGKSLLKMLMR